MIAKKLQTQIKCSQGLCIQQSLMAVFFKKIKLNWLGRKVAKRDHAIVDEAHGALVMCGLYSSKAVIV